MAKIEVTGNLGSDAELKFTNSGRPVLNFSIGDNKSKPDGKGGWETLKSQWIRAALWGDEAEFYQSRLLKGVKVTIWGEFYAREYDANDGSKRTSLDVDVQGVKVWPKRDGQGGGQQQSQPQQQNNGWGQPAQSQGGWGQVPQQEPPF